VKKDHPSPAKPAAKAQRRRLLPVDRKQQILTAAIE
jgi:hypothetical protein